MLAEDAGAADRNPLLQAFPAEGGDVAAGRAVAPLATGSGGGFLPPAGRPRRFGPSAASRGGDAHFGEHPFAGQFHSSRS